MIIIGSGIVYISKSRVEEENEANLFVTSQLLNHFTIVTVTVFTIHSLALFTFIWIVFKFYREILNENTNRLTTNKPEMRQMFKAI